jgi:predicted GIY-YIG superfamily endonuclease
VKVSLQSLTILLYLKKVSDRLIVLFSDRLIKYANVYYIVVFMFVYLITNGDRYKIGITSNLSQRLRQLQTGNDSKLSFVKVKSVKNRAIALSIERDIHRGCRNVRSNGEWFSLDSDLLRVVINQLS